MSHLRGRGARSLPEPLALSTGTQAPVEPKRSPFNMVLRIFLRIIAQSLQAYCPGAAQVDKAVLHIGAVAFIHRFGSSLNEHVHFHFHVCVVDGVFEVVQGEADADTKDTAPGVIFHPSSGIDEAGVAQVQADLRRRIPARLRGPGPDREL